MPTIRPLHLPLLAVALLAFACAGPTAPAERFGAPLVRSSAQTLPVEALLSSPERYDGATLRVEGPVSEVCAKKGCWMTLGTGEPRVRVTFQDYGFFVPTDAGGARVRVEGVFRIEETPVDEARHYLEDAGRHAEAAAITAPVRSYTLVATGVELWRP